MSSIYSLIMPHCYQFDTVDNSVKVIDSIDCYDMYKSVITRCIGYSSVIILGEVLESVKLDKYKKILMNELSNVKMFLINYALENKNNASVVKMIFELFDIKYIDEYDEIIKNNEFIYSNNRLINKRKDFDYILENFEKLINVPLLVYEECVNVMEKYMNEKLSEENKQLLENAVSETQKKMFIMRNDMSEMDDNMYKAWYDWRENANYHSYDSYPIEEQMNIWQEFNIYYEMIENDTCSESDIEMEENDYDY